MFSAGKARLITTGASALAATIALAVALPSSSGAATTSNDSTSFSVTAGSLAFSTAPGMPTLSAITLNGQAQTTDTTMTNFAVDDATGSGSGWNVTVNGNSGTGKSPVFKEYCPNSTCGTDSGPGYVSGGQTLPADSLTLGSTGASFTGQNGTTGTAPTLQCTTACNVDSATAVKIVSAAAGAGMGTWASSGWSATSLALSTPSTLKTLQTGEVYRVDLVWTLNSGP
ncbi:MAG TPA: WxL domain-containing protein [Solirubrobacteraceae bacterium]|nr:WxL domain-containing protein [Solirubrobacteraceae bacterium]